MNGLAPVSYTRTYSSFYLQFLQRSVKYSHTPHEFQIMTESENLP